EVDVEHAVPLFGRSVDEPPCLPDAGIVDHDVGHAMVRTHLGGECIDGIGVGDVECVSVCDTTQCGNLFRGITHGRLVDIAHDEFGSQAGEFECGRAADTAAGTCDRHQHVPERFATPADLSALHRPARRFALDHVGHFSDGAG